MVPKPDQARIKALLTEAITVLCKNGLGYEYNCGIQGLLGITLDDEDVFLVDLKESIVKKERPQPEPVEERSPTPVEPLSPSRVSSPAGQFIGRKRRRSGSTATDASSPAKRPSYSEDQGDDVIVIKEEGIDQDGGDMYDSGGGNGHQMPHDESYGVTLQDDPGDYGGAGCSQWETSSSSSQSAWPQVAQFDTTQQLHQQQQQQQIASSSSSSSLMTPTQGSLANSQATAPRSAIHNHQIRHILNKQFLGLVKEWQWGISPLRFNFPSDQKTVENTWNNILELRMQFDSLMLGLPETVFIVSSVTGTLIRNANARKICPCINYWVVTQDSDYDIMRNIRGFDFGQAIPKIIKTRTLSDLSILSTVVKDNVGGCVPNLLDFSLEHSDLNLPEKAQNVKIYCCNPEFYTNLETAAADLGQFGFPVWLQSVN